MKYKGYKYRPSFDTQTDCEKIFHDVLTPEGTLVHFDWSPYSTPPKEAFILWIDLGMPRRTGAGPLTMNDLLHLNYVDLVEL